MSNSSFTSIFDQLRQLGESHSQKQKGTSFEKLCLRFLQEEPVFRERFSQVWLWMDWPHRNGRQDQGIDLVAQEAASGDYCAIQCKCYSPEHVLSLENLGTYYASVGMDWGEDGSIHFASGMIIATTDKWNTKLSDTIEKHSFPCKRIGLSELNDYAVDWEKLVRGEKEVLRPHHATRPHQKLAIDDVMRGFETEDRGKLIMACGTGKTFTSLKLMERFINERCGGRGCVLFLAPSIALVSQSLREWMAQTEIKMHPIAVCSDSQASQLEDADLCAADLPEPASTNPRTINRNYLKFKDTHTCVVFSTYQSIDKVSEAQKHGALPEFDLIICDEAHRTTGVSLRTESGAYDESSFVHVHDNNFIAGRKRLYMTATPRIYTESAKSKAAEADALIASMDDVLTYGPEFHRLPFSRAVKENLLTDYKVLVLCVDEDSVKEHFAQELQAHDGELDLDDAVKLIGCYNGLRKQQIRTINSVAYRDDEESDDEDTDPSRPDHAPVDFLQLDPAPMHRAVAFAGTIKDSMAIKKSWQIMVEKIRAEQGDSPDFLPCTIDHVDGTMNMQLRSDKLAKLKEPVGPDGECRILTNARCLSEGVDVPALDAVLFLAPRRSQIDVVQSVGRVMRKAPGKKYGYIILPIGIPRDKKAEDVLDNDKKYKIIWDVLQALRSHDDRFNAAINQIDLNKGRSSLIEVALTAAEDEDNSYGRIGRPEPNGAAAGAALQQGLLSFERAAQWTEAIFARTVKKCGDRRYWEEWAYDIAEIAKRQIEAIHEHLDAGNHAAEFDEFLSGLRENIQPNISSDDAIEMLAQQLITRPVFDALFENYKFAEQNPVSKTMNRMLDLLKECASPGDQRRLQAFYDSVADRAKGIDNAEGRQRVIIELYDKFFKNAFPRMAEKLGIVYTPVEVVDFIIRSVHDVLKREFGLNKGLGAEGVKILDPFTGTGTFIVRAIQSGLISKQDLPRKFRSELFACEIVLLAYYIACVNIEVAYQGRMKATQYEPFEGICLTDTFRMDEASATDQDLFTSFEDNGERLKRLCRQPIRVIFGNPPYSVGQESANDDKHNEAYPRLDARLAETYAAASASVNKNSLYDSYIRAFRWASDRIGDSGIVAFVSNGAYIDNNAMAGFRKSLMKEFSSIYCFNLRGNQRTAGERSRKEGGKIFGSGSRTPIAITLLVKRPGDQGSAKLHYHDIGDYLSREEKLDIIKNFGSISAIPWQHPQPDEYGDWINLRTVGYSDFLPMGDKEAKGKADPHAIFGIFSRGLETARDAWVYNFSSTKLEGNIRRFIECYNEDVSRQEQTLDERQIKWSRSLTNKFRSKARLSYVETHCRKAIYRPFVRSNVYFDPDLNHVPGRQPALFPSGQSHNLVITFPAPGMRKLPMPFISDHLCDLHLNEDTQCFPLYWYEKQEGYLNFGGDETVGNLIRHQAITDWALEKFRNAYADPKIGREDIFYYVYGLLHSPEYRERFENDLRKEMPRIPFAADFWAFSRAGRELAHWHLDYETVEPYPLQENSSGDFRVTKMRFPKKGVRDTIIYNATTTLSGIPPEAYDYVVNGKSAIEWIMERYAVTTDKKSGIVNDANDWCREHNNPRYIIDLLKRIVRVSLETVRIVKSLPPLKEK